MQTEFLDLAIVLLIGLALTFAMLTKPDMAEGQIAQAVATGTVVHKNNVQTFEKWTWTKKN